jgi:hypothetical protein
MIEKCFPEIAHITNTYSYKPILFSKKSIAHKIRLSLDIRKDFLFEIPQQLMSRKFPQRKSDMWDTFSCIEEPYRLIIGNTIRKLYNNLEPFFDLKRINNLLSSDYNKEPKDQAAKIRRLFGFSLWLKKYFT